jgi:phosphoribosylamine--glycine ligase
MNLLVIGNGGREHALAWKLAQSAQVTQVFVAPGNPGTAQEAKCHNVAIGATDVPALVKFAQENAVQLTVVGPEAPLAAGVVDAFAAAGLPIFGPTRVAAQLESSKAFAKDFMARHAIPTAFYQVFTGDQKAQALEYVQEKGAPIVLKADGLAAQVLPWQEQSMACKSHRSCCQSRRRPCSPSRTAWSPQDEVLQGCPPEL